MKSTVHSKQTMGEQLRGLWERRELVWTWVKFNIQSDYIDTKLGLVWLLLNPLVTAAIYSVVFGEILGVRKPKDGVPFICFYLAGIGVWQLFSSPVSKSTRTVVTNINIMTQIRFPREIVVIVAFIEKFIEYLASFIILIVFLLIYGYYPGINYIYLPFILLIETILILGIMFYVSTLGVFIRDIGQIVQPIMRVMHLISGVLFSLENLSEEMYNILKFNPLFTIIDSFKRIVLHNELPDFKLLGVFFVIGLAILFSGYSYFKKKDGTFVDHL